MNKEEFNKTIHDNKIVLFMKGAPEQPQCGFSAQVVFILQQIGVEFTAINVFSVDKEKLKEYSQWPTFPQLWVNGKLVGGCDIVTDLAQTGELEEILQ